MTTTVISSTGIIDVFILVSILILIFVFLLKLYNILNGVKVYELSLSVIVLAIGTFAYLFIEVGVMLNFAKTTLDATVLAEYNIYFWIARLLMIFNWIFWFVELIMYSVVKNIEYMDANNLTRMSKRRNDRINRGLS